MVEILVPIAVFAMIFGIVYVVVTARNRERMALIEKGADPKLFESIKFSSRNRGLRWGLLLVGVGLGIFFASVLADYAGMNEEAAFPAMICLFGGAGLLLSHKLEPKQGNGSENH